MYKRFLFVLLLLLLTLPSFAQNGDDYARFVKDAGELSDIYRGQSPLIYNFRHTGTYYAYSENFEKGSVKYNGKIYYDLLLNLNSHLDELNILINDSKRIIMLNNNFVDYFSYGGRNFINLREEIQHSGIALEPRYYEVLYDGSVKLYKITKKIYSERISDTYNAQTQSKLERLFLTTETYYLVNGKSYIVVKNKSDLLSFYKNRKREIRKFIREQNLDFKEYKGFSLSEIIRFVESGTTKMR